MKWKPPKYQMRNLKQWLLRMLTDLKGRMDDLSENLNKETVIIKRDVETINKNQSEMKTTISDMRNLLEGINSRLDEAEA